jgi:tetratricopeptide (TPR) repeat protein
MNNFTEIILDYHSGEMTKTEKEEFKRSLNTNEPLRKEYGFQCKINKIMKQSLLLEAIENDPDLIKAEILALKDIDNYRHSNGEKRINKDFNIIEINTEVEIRKKIAKAEVEMILSGIDDVSEDWVRTFEQNKLSNENNVAAQQIVQYVKKSDPFNRKVIQMPSQRHLISRKVIFQVAAAVLVLSLLMIRPLTNSYTNDSVYDQYYEPLEANSFRLRGNSNEITGRLQEGVDYYLSKDYTHAELAFKELLKMNENLPEVLLFSGLNQMGKNNFPEAINVFNSLIAADDQFVPEAQWYLGLCYIKTGENLKAHSIMVTLSETEGLYKKKAQLILKNLKR